jgi:hypothetical protein
MASLGCGTHRGVIYTRGGLSRVMELPNILYVSWERIRDDVSTAVVKVGVDEGCCAQLGEIEAVEHELHIYRNTELVWQGPITRIEYNRMSIEFWATDILWVAKHTALSQGYSHKYVYDKNNPNKPVKMAGSVMYWLMADMTFAKYGDPWRARNGVKWIRSPDEPRTVRVTNAWSRSTWEDFDQYAQNGGMDYTVVNRSVMFWDIHLRWKVLPPLTQSYLSEEMRLVEYGSQFQTRAVVTDGEGKAGIYTTRDKAALNKYGYVDVVVNTSSDAEPDKDEDLTAEERELSEAETMASWTDRARKIVTNNPVPPLYVVVPENSALVPDAPYPIGSLIPGSWLQVDTTGMCRKGKSVWHRLHAMRVVEEDGVEKVSISLIPAPATMVVP